MSASKRLRLFGKQADLDIVPRAARHTSTLQPQVCFGRLSDTRTRFTQESNAKEGGDVSVRSVQQLHTQSNGRSDEAVLEAYLMHASEDPRWVEVSVRRGKKDQEAMPRARF